MNKFEDDDDIMKFSWIGLFSITGLCCLLFGFFMKLLDEINNFPFLKIGGFTLTLAFILYMHNYFNRKGIKKYRQQVKTTFLKDLDTKDF